MLDITVFFDVDQTSLCDVYQLNYVLFHCLQQFDIVLFVHGLILNYYVMRISVKSFFGVIKYFTNSQMFVAG